MQNVKLFSENQFSGETFNLLINAVNASHSGIIITDNQQPDNPIIFCNKAFEIISGYRREEIIGHNCRFLQADDRKQEARFIIREAVTNGTDCMVELRNYHKDGTQFWNELYLSAVKDKNGKTTHFIGVQNDITARKKAELALQYERNLLEKHVAERTQHIREHEEYLSSIIQTVRESLIVLDADTKVLSANNFFYKTFRVSEKDTIGKKFAELGNGQWNIPKLLELLEKVLPHKNPFEGFQVEHTFPDIGNKVMMLNARQIEHEGSYKNRILLAIEDISERTTIERRKDDFLSIASHELKTPLTTVKGYIQLIEKMMPADADGKLKAMMIKTNQHIERLNRLIGDLLDVTKIKAGKIDSHNVEFDFDKMIASAVESVEAITSTHKIIITGKVESLFYGDMERIEQVVINLLTNAIKYSPKSKDVSVHLSVVSDFIKVAITDSGLGINQEDQKRIFERFYRADTVQKKFPGMGIGLYVCEQIVKHHGGTLWVVSEEGKGATFNFTLPYKNNSND